MISRPPVDLHRKLAEYEAIRTKEDKLRNSFKPSHPLGEVKFFPLTIDRCSDCSRGGKFSIAPWRCISAADEDMSRLNRPARSRAVNLCAGHAILWAQAKGLPVKGILAQALRREGK